jgi:two-component system phosphate regulon response regulator OmpR
MLTAGQVPENSPHILVVDDDTRLRELLRDYLSANGFNVTTAQHAGEARRKLAGIEFDLIVLDVMMPGESGLDLTEYLKSTSRVPILLLTARGETDDRIAGLERGADDYLAKPFEPRELILRIENILRRTGPTRPETEPLSINGHAFNRDRGELRSSDDVIRLTAGEVTLLTIFAANAGSTISRLELAQRVGVNSERAIDVQIARLRRKIEPDPRNPQHLQTVWGEGYVLWPD